MKDSGNLRDFNPDRNVGSFIAKWLLLGVIVIVVLGVVGWALRWASVPGEVFSPENVAHVSGVPFSQSPYGPPFVDT